MSFGTIENDFTEFLGCRWSVKGLGYHLEQQRKANGEKDFSLEVALAEAGVDNDKATKIYDTVMCISGEDAEAAYNQGVKDGFRLTLHLLANAAPENQKGGTE